MLLSAHLAEMVNEGGVGHWHVGDPVCGCAIHGQRDELRCGDRCSGRCNASGRDGKWTVELGEVGQPLLGPRDVRFEQHATVLAWIEARTLVIDVGPAMEWVRASEEHG